MYIYIYIIFWWFYDFPFRKGNFIIPTDELIFFRGVGGSTTNQSPCS